MIADHLQGLEKFETGLWKIADNLRANSNLASNEYFMPIMGLIFLRHATNRFYEARSAIDADKKVGKMPDRPLVDADYTRRRALNLPEAARFDLILKAPKDGNRGAALPAAMEAIEAAFPPLAGQLSLMLRGTFSLFRSWSRCRSRQPGRTVPPRHGRPIPVWPARRSRAVRQP